MTAQGPKQTGKKPRTRKAAVRSAPRVSGGLATVERMMAYEAGRASALDPAWVVPSLNINSLNDQYLDRVRLKTRDVVENTPMLRGARGKFAKNIAGRTGIVPRPTVRLAGGRELDETLNNQISDLFYEFAEGVDVGRQRSLVDVQRTACHEIFVVDEVASHVAYAPAIKGFPTAPALELIPTERLPIELTGPVVNGQVQPGASIDVRRPHVRQGVEFNGAGQVTGYWVLVADPTDQAEMPVFGRGANVLAGQEVRRIDASVMHLSYTQWQPKQVRGVPPAVAALNWVRGHGTYLETELTRAQMAACIVGTISGHGMKFDPQAPENPAAVTDVAGQPRRQMDPGMFLNLPRDSEFKIHAANVPGPGFESVNQVFLYAIASGLEIPYETLAGDYSKTSFSSSRASELAARKSYQSVQQRVWDEVTRPFYRAIIDWGVLTGRIELSAAQRARLKTGRAWLYACEVSFPGWEWVNPQQEAQASQMRLKSGTTTLADECASQGRYADEVIDQRARELRQAMDVCKKLGLPEGVAMQMCGFEAPTAAPANTDGGSQDAGEGQDAPAGGGDAGEDDSEDGGEDSNQDSNRGAGRRRTA